MQHDRVALITGGGRGLGRGLALALAHTGAPVAITARSESELAETAELIRAAGGTALAVPADVTDPAAVARLVAAVETALGPVDILVNAAGVFRALGPIAEVDPGEWWREVEINLRGPYLCARAVLPGMIARRSGRIVNLASGAGLEALETVSAYCVSKAALIRLTEALALETREQGVVALAVHPGTVRTSMSEYGATSPDVAARAPLVQGYFQYVFANGVDTPYERSIAFLLAVATGRADALSGCFLDVDDDLDALLAQADAIRQDARLTLRLAR